MSELSIFPVLSRFFKFIQVSHERDRLWVSLWPWGPVLGICVCGERESCDTWQLPHWRSQLSSVFVNGEQLRWRQSVPDACRTWNLLCGRSLLFEVVRHFSQLFYGSLCFLFVFFTQLWWTWTILWLTWRPFKICIRMWVTGGFLCENLTHTQFLSMSTSGLIASMSSEEVWYGSTELT